MDADRFDSLSKRLATRISRRATLRTATASALLSGALGLGTATQGTRAAQRNTCALAFVADVRLGPSLTHVLSPTSSSPGELRGELRFALSETGMLEEGTLRLSDGTSLPVVGQATGHGLQVRIELAPRRALVAVGVGEQPVTACAGAIDGLISGPDVGDIGDWHAAVLQPSAGSGGTAGGPTPTTASAGLSPTTTVSTATATPTGTAPSAPAGSAPTPTSTPTPTFTPTPTSTPTPTVPAGPSTEATQCAAGLTNCTGVCVDLNSDDVHCGTCGLECAYGESCRGGTCTSLCDPGLSFCNGVCVDRMSDPAHCGGCGLICAPPKRCSGGACIADCAAQGLAACGGACVDLRTDESNCGTCGRVCSGGDICREGSCVVAECPSGQTRCGLVCVDLFYDALNCGACGYACSSPLICCSGACVDISSNPNHCGMCDNVCLVGDIFGASGACENYQCT